MKFRNFKDSLSTLGGGGILCDGRLGRRERWECEGVKSWNF